MNTALISTETRIALMRCRTLIATGPWEPRPAVYGQPCQICQRPIFEAQTARVRYGDGVSPAVYRHGACH